MGKNKKKNYLIYISLIFSFVALSVGIVFYVNAYFSALSTEKEDLSFANVSLQINTNNPNNNLFATTLKQIVPEDTISFSNVSVENTGEADMYTLLNLNIEITKTNNTRQKINHWYNLNGGGV